MAKKRKYSLVYDKLVFNNVTHSNQVERRHVTAPNRDVAERIMKKDIYRNGGWGGVAFVRYQNGSVEKIKPREPRRCISTQEYLSSHVRSERKSIIDFGHFDK